METVSTPSDEANRPPTLVCGCGFELTGRELDVLVERAQRHAAEVHGMRLGAEQIVASIGAGTDTTDRSQGSTRREEDR